MRAALSARVRGLALTAALLTALGSGVVVGAAPASAAICTAVPGVSATFYMGACIRYVIPFPTDIVTLPKGSPIPEGAYPARLLGPDEPAPLHWLQPETRTVWFARPDGSIAVFTPKPVSPPVTEPAPPTEPPPPSEPELPPVDFVAPGAPTDVVATAGNSSASVRWTAAADGFPVTDYTVTAHVDGVPQLTSAGWTGTTGTVRGLRNGIVYTFTVTAHGAQGQVAESEHSAAVTPATVPAAPVAVTARPGNAVLQVSWRAPSTDGGRSLTGYTVRAYRGNTLVKAVAAPAGALGATVTGLVNGAGYTVTVTANNALGAGQTSARSAASVPGTRPSAPRLDAVTPANGAVVVRWAPPANGGRAITSYTVRVYYGTAVVRTTVVSPRATSVVVPRLVNGARYSFTVTAINELGAGPSSARSAVVTPRR